MSWSSRDTGAVVLCAVLLILSTPIVAARLWTRRCLQRLFGVEDWLIFAAYLITVGLLIGIALAICVFHFGEHISQLTIQQRVNAAWWLFTSEAIYIIDSATIKVAILLFYHRLADRTQGKGFFYTLYAVMGWVALYKTAYIITILLSCQPLKARWLREDPTWAVQHSFTCVNEPLNLLLGSTISATEDLVIAFMPTLILWNLQMNRHQKLAVGTIFALSSFTGICSYIRTYVVYNAYWTKDDYMCELYWLWLLSAMEVAIGLACSSAPALKPFLRHFKIGQKICAPMNKVTGAVVQMDTMNSKYSRRSKIMSIWSPKAPPASLAPRRDGGIFDGSRTSGNPENRSYVAQSSWNGSLATCSSEKCFATQASMDTIDDDRSGPSAEDVEAQKRSSSSSSRPELPDVMWISVRRSITIYQEIGNA